MSSPPAQELIALLGRGTKFSGKLSFTGPVRIDGTFEGEIVSEGTLVIGEGADVQADILVDTLIVRGGTVKGRLQARTSIELYVPAAIVGDLRSPSIFIDRGVRVEGSCVMAPVTDHPPPDSLSPST